RHRLPPSPLPYPNRLLGSVDFAVPFAARRAWRSPVSVATAVSSVFISLMEGYPSVRLAIPCLLAEEAERRMVRQGRLVLVVLVGILVAWSCPDPGEGKA